MLVEALRAQKRPTQHEINSVCKRNMKDIPISVLMPVSCQLHPRGRAHLKIRKVSGQHNNQCDKATNKDQARERDERERERRERNKEKRGLAQWF